MDEESPEPTLLFDQLLAEGDDMDGDDEENEEVVAHHLGEEPADE